jgi:hypothetical protein
MSVTVEPLDGSELDRLVTALLSATGVVYRAIEATDEGEPLVDAVARRAHGALASFAEHYSDEELGQFTGVLAHITLLLAEDLGLGHHFRPGGERPGAP